MNPLGRRMKSSEGIPIVAGIWILSVLLSIPYALHHQVNFSKTKKKLSLVQSRPREETDLRVSHQETFLSYFTGCKCADPWDRETMSSGVCFNQIQAIAYGRDLSPPIFSAALPHDALVCFDNEKTWDSLNGFR